MAAKRKQTWGKFLSHSDISYPSFCGLLRKQFQAVRRFESRSLPNTFQQSVFGSDFIWFLSTSVSFHLISLSIRPPFFVSFLSIELSAPSVSSTIFAKLLSFFFSFFRSLFLTFLSSFKYFFTSVFLLPFYWILFALQPSFCWIPSSYSIIACTAVCSAMTAR